MDNFLILIRCSDDWRVLDCLESVDVPVRVVVSMTPNEPLQKAVAERGIPTVLSPRGNPAATTLAGLEAHPARTVLLVDSDCEFLPGAIARMQERAAEADIVRPTVTFLHTDASSRATAVCRDFQYTYNGFVYEPGLLVRLDRTLPKVGGYLFSPHAPFTPDGEFDFRVRETDLRVTTDDAPTITHAPLSFRMHLRSYWRYGASEASRMVHLRQPVLRGVLRGLPFRYRSAFSRRYPWSTPLLLLPCDLTYLTSTLWHLAKRRS